MALDFLIIYEHKARELDNICLIKAELELRGYSVDLVQLRDSNLLQYQLWNKPKVCVTFALYNDSVFVGHVAFFAGHTRKVANLQWEQLYSNNDSVVRYHMPTERAALATHICWGKESFEQLTAAGVKNAIITGAVQLDFLKAPLKRCYLSTNNLKEKYHITKKKIYLYISSFVYATFSEEEIKDTEQKLGNIVSEMQKIAIESRKITLEWLERLTKDCEDACVVYRPHPDEDIDGILKEIVERNSEFRVVKEENVKQWIMAADEIFTWFSTSATEVFYADKNCMILRPIPIPHELDSILFTNASFITSYEACLQELQKDEREFPIPVHNIIQYYGEKNKGFAYKNVAKLLEAIRNTSRYDIKEFTWKLHLLGFIRRIRNELAVIMEKRGCFHRVGLLKKKIERFQYHNIKYAHDRASKEEIEERTALFKELIKDEADE